MKYAKWIIYLQVKRIFDYDYNWYHWQCWIQNQNKCKCTKQGNCSYDQKKVLLIVSYSLIASDNRYANFCY